MPNFRLDTPTGYHKVSIESDETTILDVVKLYIEQYNASFPLECVVETGYGMVLSFDNTLRWYGVDSTSTLILSAKRPNASSSSVPGALARKDVQQAVPPASPRHSASAGKGASTTPAVPATSARKVVPEKKTAVKKAATKPQNNVAEIASDATSTISSSKPVIDPADVVATIVEIPAESPEQEAKRRLNMDFPPSFLQQLSDEEKAQLDQIRAGDPVSDEMFKVVGKLYMMKILEKSGFSEAPYAATMASRGVDEVMNAHHRPMPFSSSSYYKLQQEVATGVTRDGYKLPEKKLARKRDQIKQYEEAAANPVITSVLDVSDSVHERADELCGKIDKLYGDLPDILEKAISKALPHLQSASSSTDVRGSLAAKQLQVRHLQSSIANLREVKDMQNLKEKLHLLDPEKAAAYAAKVEEVIQSKLNREVAQDLHRAEQQAKKIEHEGMKKADKESKAFQKATKTAQKKADQLCRAAAKAAAKSKAKVRAARRSNTDAASSEAKVDVNSESE
jgi:hypothetical protein